MNKSYLQDKNCLSLPINIERCIECLSIQKMKTKSIKTVNDNDILCRFYQFRILKLSKSGKLNVVGFPNPYSSPTDSELEIWLPDENLPTPSSFDKKVSKKILEEIGGQFCQFVNDEREVLHLSLPNNQKKKPKILWKKYVNGIREMCDVCKTSIFNYHGSCRKCGFVVCIDCYRTELHDTKLIPIYSLPNSYNKEKWLLCTDERKHNVRQLSITQMLAGDVMNYICKHMHSVCKKDNINIICDCKLPGVSTTLVTDKNHISGKNNQTSSNSRQGFYSRTSETKEIQNKKIYSTISNENIQDKRHGENIYMWLCDGRLLRLLDPKHKNNHELFQVCKNTKC